MRPSLARTVFAATMLVIGHVPGEAVALTLFSDELHAQQHCANDTVVWLDLKKRRYYLPGQRQYGHGRTAIFVCRGEASEQGYRRSLLGLR